MNIINKAINGNEIRIIYIDTKALQYSRMNIKRQNLTPRGLSEAIKRVLTQSSCGLKARKVFTLLHILKGF